jgi:hypothetical protein
MKFTFPSLHLGLTLISLEIREFDAARTELTSFTTKLRGRVLKQKVQVVGNNGNPGSAFPLIACQGDCDVNDDCKGMLECFHRDGGEAVPGCGGGELDSSRTDFCYDPTGGPTPVTPTASPATQLTDTPVAQPTVAQPTAGPPVTFVGNNGGPSSVFPLMACQGDCDVDDDCEGMLECFQRDGGEAVPGCGGGELDSSRTDYCFDPAGGPTPVTPTASPVADLSPSPATNLSPSPAVDLSPSPVADLSPSPIADLSPSPIADLSPSPVADLSPSPVADLSPSPVADPSPTPVADLSPSPVGDLSPSPAVDLSPSPVADLSPSPIADLSPSPVANLSPSPVGDLSPSPVADLSPSPVADLSPSPVADQSPYPIADRSQSR